MKVNEHAGGGGIDVSRALFNLGIRNIAMGFIGGRTGNELKNQLEASGIICQFTNIKGETRTNIIINEMCTKKQKLFCAHGPRIEEDELEDLRNAVENLKDPEIVIIAGSLPQEVSTKFYKEIIKIVKGTKAIVILDMDGDALHAGISYEPNIIKLNIHELQQYVWRNLNSIEEVLKCARFVNRCGAKIVLVSMGEEGILLVSDGMEYLAVPPEIKEPENTVGAGDSAVAGFIYGLINCKDLKESLRCATAAGTASTLNFSTSLCEKKKFEELISQISLYVISDSKT